MERVKMPSSSYGNYLAHYGVLGMKWGLASGMDLGESILTGILGYGVNTITGGIYSLAEPRNTAYKKQKVRAARG